MLAGSLALPVGAAPKYPSKDDVSKAEQDAGKSARAAAEMRKKLAAERATLNRLDTETEMAVEAYNGAVYKLGKAEKAHASAKKRAAESAAAVEEARGGLAAVARRAYAGSGVTEYATLLGSDDPTSAAEGASMLHALSAQQGGAVDRFRAAKVVQTIVRKQKSKALAAQRAETKRVAAAKRAAQRKLAAQQKVLGDVAALESKLANQAAREAREANGLAEERREGIAEARRIAAEKAAAEARKRAEEARERAAAAAQQNKDENNGDGRPSVSPQSYGSGGKAAVRFARAQIGKWYEWAADGPDTFDCSGLTMRAWQQGGRSLPHYSVAQWDQTSRVSLSSLRKGDLVFYADNTNNPSTIHHVGIFIGDGRMIEAPYTGAQVRIASIYRDDLIGAGRP